MSHYSDFRLLVLEKGQIASHFGEELTSLLMGNTEIEPANVAKRSMRGSTRSDWFKWMIGHLLDKTPYSALQFLSENACTHVVLKNDNGIVEESYLDSLDEEDDEREFMTHLYTVIPPEKIGDVLTDVNNLFSWCNQHIKIVSDVIEAGEDEVKNAIMNAKYYDRVNDADYGDDGDGVEFFFCALKSVQELLTYAQTHQLYAIYENENYTGLEWLKNNRPRIIHFE